MTKFVEHARAAGGIARLMSGIGPQIYLDPPNDQGVASPEDVAAAEAAAAEKAAADKAAADAAAADAAEAVAAEELAAAEAAAAAADADKDKKALLREVMDKKAKLKAATEEKDRLASDLKRFEGIDPDLYKTMLNERTERERKEAEARGDFEAVKKSMAEAHAAETKTLSEQIAELQAQLAKKDGAIDELTVGQSFVTSKFITEDLVLTPSKARQLYGSHFELKDGKLVAYEDSARKKPITDASGNPLDFDAALKRIIEADPEKDSLLRAKQKPGAASHTAKVPPVDPNIGVELRGTKRIAAALAARNRA